MFISIAWLSVAALVLLPVYTGLLKFSSLPLQQDVAIHAYLYAMSAL